jgi:hypothetical protein
VLKTVWYVALLNGDIGHYATTWYGRVLCRLAGCGVPAIDLQLVRIPQDGYYHRAPDGGGSGKKAPTGIQLLAVSHTFERTMEKAEVSRSACRIAADRGLMVDRCGRWSMSRHIETITADVGHGAGVVCIPH